jgi:hypothetical protein
MAGPPEMKCISIKSKKNTSEKCPLAATKGEFCSRHSKSKVRWVKPVVTLTRSMRVAGLKVLRFLQRYATRLIYKRRGPAVFTPEICENLHDVYTLEETSTIPILYRFSYVDSKKHVWIFDIRFFTQCLTYTGSLLNPFTQESITGPSLERFQNIVASLRKSNIPVLYTEDNELTPEQIWNQKVLDLFLRLSSHGYAVNLSWFDSLSTSGHASLYRHLYNGWMSGTLTDADRERIVPKYRGAKTSLFRYPPQVISSEQHPLKWWRKQTLYVMNVLLTRSEDKATQGIGAIFILTAFAKIYPSVRESFPWLVQ